MLILLYISLTNICRNDIIQSNIKIKEVFLCLFIKWKEKNGLQKYRVRVNYTDCFGNSRQIDRIAYGKREAQELELRLNFNIEEELVPKLKFQKVAEEYIATKANEVRETTTAKHKSLLNKYILPFLGNCRIDKIGVKQVQDWKQYINEQNSTNGKKLSLKYKQNIYTTFSAVLNYAVKMEYISCNPLSKLGNFKDSSLIRKEMDFYTAEEFKRFIAAAKQRAEETELTGNIHEWNFYIFFMLAFYTGMRRGEINALKWTDIKNNSIYITRSIVQKLKGKDRETPPKNKSSVRAIQIPKPLKAALTAHYHRNMQQPNFDESYRICGGARCLRDATIDFRNKEYSQAAGIKTIRIHDYRHPYVKLKLKILSAYFSRTFGAKVLDFPHDFNPVIGIYTHLFDKHIGKCLR